MERKKGFIRINGQKVPYPDRGLKLVLSTLTTGGRNKNGKVVATKVGRDNHKLDSLQWNWLSAEEWSRILNLVKGYYIDVTFPKSSDLIPVAFWKELLPIVVPSSLPLIVIEVILLSSAKA